MRSRAGACAGTQGTPTSRIAVTSPYGRCVKRIQRKGPRCPTTSVPRCSNSPVTMCVAVTGSLLAGSAVGCWQRRRGIRQATSLERATRSSEERAAARKLRPPPRFGLQTTRLPACERSRTKARALQRPRPSWASRSLSPSRGCSHAAGVRRSGVPLMRSVAEPTASPRPIILGVSTSPARVVLADDDVLLREGLAGLLERSGFDVVGQCGTATELIEFVREQPPELAIVDIRMPPTHTNEGLEAASTIREEFPEMAIVVLTAYVQVERATELLEGGQRCGYLLKTRITDVDEFIETLERIVRGAAVVDPALVSELVAARRREDPLDVLSPREHEVLELMAEGRSNAGIAHKLWITEGTVEKHVRSVLMKLRLPATEDDQRRVLAVITYLDAR